MKFLFDRKMLLIALLFAITIYAVEITHFSLSIDEGLASFAGASWSGWISQGRWGMALLSVLLPNFSALPIISTLIFAAGLAASGLVFASLFARTKVEAIIFIGLFVSSPIWLHIGEFNTLSWGVGIGLFACAVAAHLVLKPNGYYPIVAGLLVAFALATYQSLVVIYATTCLAVLVGTNSFWQSPASDLISASRGRLFLRMLLSGAIASVAYSVIQLLALRTTHLQMGYVEGFMQLSEYATNYNETFARVDEKIVGLLTGADATFLGWGWAVLLLAWMGLAAGLFEMFFTRRISPFAKLVSLLALIFMIGAASALIIVSAGRIPTRALVSFPLIYALLGLNGFRASYKLKWLSWSLFAYSFFVCLWIATSLFYLDQVARERDLVTGTRLVQKIEEVAGQQFAKSIPIVLVGELQYEDTIDGHQSNVEIFGTSFFQQDGGNVYRVSAYLRLLGMRGLEPLPLNHLRDQLPSIRKMPAWPASGSVAIHGNAVVVKLSPISYQQQLTLQ